MRRVILFLLCFPQVVFALSGADSTNSKTRVIQNGQGMTVRPNGSILVGAVTPAGTRTNAIVFGFGATLLPDTTRGVGRRIGTPDSTFEISADTLRVSVITGAAGSVGTLGSVTVSTLLTVPASGDVNFNSLADSSDIKNSSVSLDDLGQRPIVIDYSTTNPAQARRFEWASFIVRVQNVGGDNKYDITDATQAYSGTSKYSTAGFFTTSTSAQAVVSAGTHTGADAYLDTDDNSFRIKKTQGAVVNVGTVLEWDLGYTVATTTSIRGAQIFTVTADAGFTGSPSSIKILLYNAAGSVISPWSLVGSGETFDIKISGVVRQ